MKGRQLLWWRGLHLVLGLMIPFVLAFLLSCKRAKEEKADLGPEASDDEIDMALHRAVQGRTLKGTHVGEFAHYSVLRRLENSESLITLGSINVRVAHENKSEEPGFTMFTLDIDKYFRRKDGTFDEIQSEEPRLVETSLAPLSALNWTSHGLSAAGLGAYASEVRAMERPVVRTSFHKLRTEKGTVPAPEQVRSRPGCGGLPNCEIPVNYIRFDAVAWYSDTDYQRVSLDFAFSIATPYLPFGQNLETYTGLLVTDCRSTYVPVELENGQTRNVYVRDCQQLDDFQK